jgi:uncharacterized protein (DUF608 family)
VKEKQPLKSQRIFSGDSLGQIVFPIGGIGTGSVGLTGIGGLKDWEIFNRPNFGSTLPLTFPIIFAREKGKEPVCRVLQGPVLPPYTGRGAGDPHDSGQGFPHMDACTFRGEYPFAYIDFQSRKLPVKVALEAYNPFIPSAPDDSGFPAAILRYTLTNTTKNRVEATVAWNLYNPIGSLGVAEGDKHLAAVECGIGKNVNARVDGKDLRGLRFSSSKWAKDHPRFGSMALVTPEKNVTVATHWQRGGWFAPWHEFWDTFSETGLLPQHKYPPSEEGQSDAGALGIRVALNPGQTKTVTFYLTWYFPTFEKYWHGCEGKCEAKPTWKNYYAGQFKDAVDVARKLHARHDDLYAKTRLFHDALFSSTMPAEVLDAVSSQMAILKTATCIRLSDGTFYGFEGCSPAGGCCEGSCTHVWNYQQALPFLFPGLERSMRSADYALNMRRDGGMCFRLQLPAGTDPNDFHACADGQMGGIIKTYRDWKIGGDDVWLRGLWPKVKRALEFAWVAWDAGKDGVMGGIQHNTYDIEFLGPNPLTACFYLGALTAGAEMADFMGETETADAYRRICEKGREWIDANLFNGEFYVQKYDPKEAPGVTPPLPPLKGGTKEDLLEGGAKDEYQFGKGCLSDAMLGQWLTSLCGLGHVLEPRRVRKALRAIYKHNWRKDLSEHANAQRVYALNHESGLLLCSWPNGGRPAIPFPYSDEVWTGIEYQVASHLIMEGLVREGLSIVKGARDRHDGVCRNPWDEFECGHHYARAMSSYGLLTALSGFTFDKGAGTIGFAPMVAAKTFRTFWALDNAWGTFEQTGKSATLRVLYGLLTLNRLDLAAIAGAKKVACSLGRRSIAGEIDDLGSVIFPKAPVVRPGFDLTVAAVK